MNEITRERLQEQWAAIEKEKEELAMQANMRIAFLNGKQEAIDDLLKTLPAPVPARNGHRAAKVVEAG